MILNLNSDKVKVFPIANRTNNTLSEENVTFMMRPLFYGKGFVSSVEKIGEEVRCIFNLLGYTFEVYVTPNSTWTNIYAGIELTGTNMIMGQDESGVYKGLTLSDEPVINGKPHVLHIATKTNGEWKVPGDRILAGMIAKIDGKR